MMAKKNKVSGRFTGFVKFIFFVYVASIIFGTLIRIPLVSDDTENISLANGYTISAYSIILDVKEDNKIDVTENITVNWKSRYHHGIYKFTPEWLQYTDKNGNTIKRKSTVSNLRSTSDPYTTDWVKKKARIKLGSASEYVSLGEKTYNI